MTTRSQLTSGLPPAADLPRLPRVYVPRERLWERLDRATESSLTLVVGPMGSGKTLGVSGWLQDRGLREVHWLQGTPEVSAVELLEQVDPPDKGGAAPTRRPPLLVVDDAHLLSPAAVRALDALLDEHPDRMRVLLLSRWDLAVTRLGPELLGNLTVLRGDLLRLDEHDSAVLVAAHSRCSEPAVAAIVAERTQGWCAAVVLTARAIAAAPDPLAAAQRLASHNTVAADAVASEVFATLPPSQRHLLLCVAAEEHVTVATAIHLTRDQQCAEILGDLETTGLLVTRLGGSGEPSPGSDRYRIHPLLAEVVRRRLAAGGADVEHARGTVLRAVRSDVARDDLDRSFDRLLTMGHDDAAADLLVTLGETLLEGRSRPDLKSFARFHPEVVQDHPAAWFTLALERWQDDDLPGALGWLDDLLTWASAHGLELAGEAACARLMRARLGIDSMPQAVQAAECLLADRTSSRASAHVLPRLLCELGTDQAWLGDLDRAEDNLTEAVQLGRAAGLTGLVASALTQLAFTLYMQGRERDCSDAAAEALALASSSPWSPAGTVGAARAALQLGSMADVPWPEGDVRVGEEVEPMHPADLTARFWSRLRDARRELAAGSVMQAEQILRAPVALPRRPRHLRLVVLVELAFLAALASDEPQLRTITEALARLSAEGEAELVRGLLADLRGERRAAARHFAAAAGRDMTPQPAARPLALTCAAQLHEALGEPQEALMALQEAVTATEVRRNAAPFLGWTRQGSPLHPLLERLADESCDPWVQDLTSATEGHPGMVAVLAPWTPSTRERESAAATVLRPDLSPRERDVLHELARGSTYSDISASLFVSENTVKTHVSSLYGKLGVSRRSEALAVSRNFGLI